MMMLYVFLAVAGVLNTVQAGSNATLHKQIHHPILPAIVSFATGIGVLFAVLLIYTWATGIPMPTLAQWKADARVGPWWMWTGGLLGAVYVLAMVNVSEKVGAAVFTGITVTAGIVMSLAMDHFGLLGFKQHTASIPRIIGGVLMIVGLFLIGKF